MSRKLKTPICKSIAAKQSHPILNCAVGVPKEKKKEKWDWLAMMASFK